MHFVMKRIVLMFIVCSACFNLFAAGKSKKEVVDFVHPLNWYAGMRNPKLQVLLHGDNIASMDVTLENERNITLDEVVKVENKNYLILYLNTNGAPAQNFNILLNSGKKTYTVPYQLLKKADYNRKSFDSSDVVYLLMPDRFANGSKENDVVEGMRETVCDSNIPLARHGGDLQGMTAKLDYLADLGVTAIWPTPVLENDMEMQLSKYQTISGQLENAKAKVQEQTPAFTVIKSPTVPIKPAGPKRMIFVAAMLIMATLGTTMWYLRRLIIAELI